MGNSYKVKSEFFALFFEEDLERYFLASLSLFLCVCRRASFCSLWNFFSFFVFFFFFFFGQFPWENLNGNQRETNVNDRKF